MIRLFATVAIRHLLARRRQSIVSMLGIVLGVAFFLSISAMMQGSENDFKKRLVDNSPHISIADEYRNPTLQPVEQNYPGGAVEISRIKPQRETRGVRGFQQVIDYLRSLPGVRASPLLIGQALVTFAGKDVAISLNGIVPAEYAGVSTIENYMTRGSLAELIANPNGIIIGDELARVLSLVLDGNLTVTTTAGQSRTFKIVGIFHTGRVSVDEGQAFVTLKRVQALLDRPNRANTIIVKLDDAERARNVAADVENHIGYKSVSWQEQSEDLMSTLLIRRIIMYTVVAAVLVVAAFGIYNVISTVVMEKQRDIAILKSIGFHARDIERIFLAQGILLGIAGNVCGLALGCVLMFGMMHIRFKFPGGTDYIYMAIDWGWPQFTLAAGVAMASSIAAALLPARKAARVQPVDILRGGV
jgi:lipoprotein-releasing system permease protein